MEFMASLTLRFKAVGDGTLPHAPCRFTPVAGRRRHARRRRGAGTVAACGHARENMSRYIEGITNVDCLHAARVVHSLSRAQGRLSTEIALAISRICQMLARPRAFSADPLKTSSAGEV